MKVRCDVCGQEFQQGLRHTFWLDEYLEKAQEFIKAHRQCVDRKEEDEHVP